MSKSDTPKISSAYFGAIVVWSVTPLAVKWSTEDIDFLFAAASRSLLAALSVFILCLCFRHRLPLTKTACQVYLIGGLGNFGIVFFSLWGIQYIPSGWMALVYATSPILTSCLAAMFLNERQYGLQKTGGLLISVMGIGIIINLSLDFGPNSIFGLLGILLSVLCYSGSNVAIKRISIGIDAFSINSGSLIVAAILYLMVWLASEHPLPDVLSNNSIYGIIFTAVVTSAIGNSLFYYILKNIDATRATLLTLITPVVALIIGNLIESEPLEMELLLGAAMVLAGIVFFEFRPAGSS